MTEPEAPEATTQTWQMWAGRDAQDQLVDFGSKTQVRLRGHVPEPVLLIESADGPYWAWIPAPLPHIQERSSRPRHIYRRRLLFEVCFDATPESMQEAGKGRIARLAVLANPDPFS